MCDVERSRIFDCVAVFGDEGGLPGFGIPGSKLRRLTFVAAPPRSIEIDAGLGHDADVPGFPVASDREWGPKRRVDELETLDSEDLADQASGNPRQSSRVKADGHRIEGSMEPIVRGDATRRVLVDPYPDVAGGQSRNRIGDSALFVIPIGLRRE